MDEPKRRDLVCILAALARRNDTKGASQILQALKRLDDTREHRNRVCELAGEVAPAHKSGGIGDTQLAQGVLTRDACGEVQILERRYHAGVLSHHLLERVQSRHPRIHERAVDIEYYLRVLQHLACSVPHERLHSTNESIPEHRRGASIHPASDYPDSAILHDTAKGCIP